VVSVAVSYTNYSDDGINVINGTESAAQQLPASPFGNTTYTWNENLTLTGCHTGTEISLGPDGNPGPWIVTASAITGSSTRTGTLTTTIDGVSYTSPPTGT
jgi:hypothetical protein